MPVMRKKHIRGLVGNTLYLNVHFQICPPVLHSLVSSLEGKPVILVLRGLLERDLRQEEM